MRKQPMSTTKSASPWTRALAGALGGALALALAAPALAGSAYRWETPEGGLAFTDDPERIPARHRDAAESLELRGLEGYARFTPQREGSSESYEGRLAERLERLRALNDSSRDVRERAGARSGAPAGRAVVDLEGPASLRVPAPAAGAEAEPVVVEQVRVREPGGSATKTDTVVRQGDRVLVVVSPLGVARSRPGSVPSESTLLGGGSEEAEE